MSIVTPRIYLGDANNANDANFLKSRRVSLIVNCAKEIPNYFESANSPQYINLELNDVPTQPIEKALKYASDAILDAISKKRTVFVHCAAGISRSSSIVIYTIMKLYQWSFEKSYRFVKNMRPQIRPNPGFVDQLIKMSQSPNDPITQSQNLSNAQFENVYTETDVDMGDSTMYGVVTTETHPQSTTSLTLDNDHARPDYARPPKNSYAKIFK